MASIYDLLSPRPLLWAINLSELDSSSVWEFVLTQLSPIERDKVNYFVFLDDRKRAALSILLQRAMLRRYLEIDSDDRFDLRRTSQVFPIL
jgi:hypothetical protein